VFSVAGSALSSTLARTTSLGSGASTERSTFGGGGAFGGSSWARSSSRRSVVRCSLANAAMVLTATPKRAATSRCVSQTRFASPCSSGTTSPSTSRRSTSSGFESFGPSPFVGRPIFACLCFAMCPQKPMESWIGDVVVSSDFKRCIARDRCRLRRW
jgi:hypothetical protein